MLFGCYNVPEEEARTCGLAVFGLWQPVDRPAYKDPICFLDCSSVQDFGRESVRWLDLANYLKFDPKMSLEDRLKSKEAVRDVDPTKVPAATQDAPGLAPLFAPQHRWVYCPDMGPDEAALFKQYDWRPSAATTRVSFHSSFSDKFHADWKECPGRRSVECRLVLTFNDEPVAKL